MKQFYELYQGEEKVSPLVTQLSWSNHLKIMSACKTMDERIFYMNMCIKERLSKRELERQIDNGYYERYMLSQNSQSLALETAKKSTGNIFLDNYVLDFLDVPDPMSEHDLQKSIIRNLKDFILEIGNEVVEFALSRSLSPKMVVEYNLKLIDKKLLQKKLKEYIELAKLTEDKNAQKMTGLYCIVQTGHCFILTMK